jgi:hypothetical protein
MFDFFGISLLVVYIAHCICGQLVVSKHIFGTTPRPSLM